MVTIGQVDFFDVEEVWNNFTGYQTPEEFFSFGKAGQSPAEQIREYVAEVATDTRPGEPWGDFLAVVNRQRTYRGSGDDPYTMPLVPVGERISPEDAAAAVERAMMRYAEERGYK